MIRSNNSWFPKACIEIPWCHRASGIEGFEDMNKEQVCYT
jgi:hypothetical protein